MSGPSLTSIAARSLDGIIAGGVFGGIYTLFNWKARKESIQKTIQKVLSGMDSGTKFASDDSFLIDAIIPVSATTVGFVTGAIAASWLINKIEKRKLKTQLNKIKAETDNRLEDLWNRINNKFNFEKRAFLPGTANYLVNFLEDLTHVWFDILTKIATGGTSFKAISPYVIGISSILAFLAGYRFTKMINLAVPNSSTEIKDQAKKALRAVALKPPELVEARTLPVIKPTVTQSDTEKGSIPDDLKDKSLEDLFK